MNYWLVWWMRLWQAVFIPLATPPVNAKQADENSEQDVSSGHVSSDSDVGLLSQQFQWRVRAMNRR